MLKYIPDLIIVKNKYITTPLDRDQNKCIEVQELAEDYFEQDI